MTVPTTNPEIFVATWVPWLLAITGASAACYERFLRRRRDEAKEFAKSKDEEMRQLTVAKDELIKQKDELARTIAAERDEWKSQAAMRHTELSSYRDETHKKNEISQAQMIRLAEDNAKLRAATDMTPIQKHMEEQTEINRRQLSVTEELLTYFRGLHQQEYSKQKPKTKTKA